MIDKEKVLTALKELTEKIESGEAKAIGMNIQAEVERIDRSDFDGREFEHVETGIRNLIIKYCK